ncbi:MAG: ATP-binding cassette domain-containing protein [Deltaproteobacteria bacterium]|nr:ATP-binding cassette domain-containing protein [Deltaproteobacteria bacterium]
MTSIVIDKLGFAYGGGPELIKDLCLGLSTDWRLGLVGRNGSGKTTLLRILAGDLPFSGTISSKATMVYFPFGLPDPGAAGPGQLMGLFPGLRPWRLEEEAGLVGLAPETLARPAGTLSPGERTKLRLAALFALDGVFPLIDEPTGGLDAAGREKVAAYLAGKGGFILVSHDRLLLETATDHILSFGRQGPELHKGSFGSFWEERARRAKTEEELSRRLSGEMVRLSEAAGRATAWAGKTERGKYGQGPVDRGFIGHKAAKAAKRAKAIADRRQRAADAKGAMRFTAEMNLALSMSPLAHRSRTLVEGRGLCLGYDGRAVLEGLDLVLEAGERLAVRGANGSGKTLLMEFLAGAGGRLLSGNLRLAAGLSVSYVPQRAALGTGSIAGLCQGMGLDVSRVRTMLHYLGLGRESLSSRLEDLSQGQARKVWLALSLAREAHLYIWDEPLDFLDLHCRSQIEDLVLESGPSLIVVEHDLAFLGRVATRILDLGGLG